MIQIQVIIETLENPPRRVNHYGKFSVVDRTVLKFTDLSFGVIYFGEKF
jgi:hypothetical protein